MHFTYNEPDNTALKQGDILKKTPDLINLLKEVHPHYVGEQYKYFQIITQTCDLVRRGNNNICKSRYITLAAVRCLDDIVERAIDNIAEKKTKLEDIICCSDGHKFKLQQFLERLFNNNETNYFFLKDSPSYGLNEDSCTLLHLSIAIRAYQHYEICLEAKILELKEIFRAKLGWLVSNLYSRIGTEDYVPGALPSKTSFKKLIKENLDKHIVWISNVRLGFCR